MSDWIESKIRPSTSAPRQDELYGENIIDRNISRVAALEQQLRDAVAAERERCAKVCEDAMPREGVTRRTLVDCAAAIREGAPAREWRGLSEDAIVRILDAERMCWSNRYGAPTYSFASAFARAIEAELKARNA